MYAKLFKSIYQGTLRGDSGGILVFTNLLANADQTGRVDMHPRAIAEEIGLDVERVKEILLRLEAPDDESRSPELEGRRIVRIDGHRAWGWEIVNYLKYRAIRNEEDRREQNRASQERWRNKQNKPASAEGKQEKPRKPESAKAEAEAEAKAEEEIQALRAMSPANAADLRADASPEENTRPQKPSIPATPYQSIVDAYHAALPTLPQVRLMSEARKKGISRLWKFAFTSKKPDGTPRATNADEALKWIGFYFIRAKQNEFLMGKNGRTGTHANWMPDIDFLTTDKGMSQVIEKT
jgi:hypothetical protein